MSSFLVCDEGQHRFFVGMWWPLDHFIAPCFTTWPEAADHFSDKSRANDVAAHLRSYGCRAEVYTSDIPATD